MICTKLSELNVELHCERLEHIDENGGKEYENVCAYL